MSAFCKKCGFTLDPNSAFCDNCGAPVNAASTAQPPAVESGSLDTSGPLGSPADPRRTYVMSRKVLYGGGAVAVLLAVVVAATVFLFGPPPANSATLVTAYKAVFADQLQRDSKNQLCISNLNYRLDKFNAGENDSSTRRWMDALVLAGLYDSPVSVQGGSVYFPQTLLQYIPTPELAKWREGGRLCVAKSIVAVEVIDIAKPVEEQMRPNDLSKTLVARGKVVTQASDTASWLEKPEVRATVLAELNGWEYKAGKLQKKIPTTFFISDGKWVTLAESSVFEERQSRVGQDTGKTTRRATENGGEKWLSGLSEKISGLLNFSGNPLKGDWEPELNRGSIVTITDNALVAEAVAFKCNFLVKGNRVTASCKKVTDNELETMEFVILDKNRMALVKDTNQFLFNRVK